MQTEAVSGSPQQHAHHTMIDRLIRKMLAYFLCNGKPTAPVYWPFPPLRRIGLCGEGLPVKRPFSAAFGKISLEPANSKTYIQEYKLLYMVITRHTTIQVSEATLKRLKARKEAMGLQSYDILLNRLLELSDHSSLSVLIDERIAMARQY